MSEKTYPDERCYFVDDEFGRCGLAEGHNGAHFEAPWRNLESVHVDSDSVVSVRRDSRGSLAVQVVFSKRHLLSQQGDSACIRLVVSLSAAKRLEKAIRSARGGDKKLR